MNSTLLAGAAKLAVGVAAVTGLGLGLAQPAHAQGCSTDADCAADAAAHPGKYAPAGYHFDVTTKSGYHFRAMKHEDSRVGVWNAAERGNGGGQSFVGLAHQPPSRIYLGVNDKAQGGDYNGVVAWTKHYAVRVDNEVIYKRGKFVAEVDTTVRVKGRVFYVIASAIWK